MAGLFTDSKHFVDMSIRPTSSLTQMLGDWSILEREEADMETLMKFVERHFSPPGSEMIEVCLHDDISEASEQSRIGLLTRHVKSLWSTLTRQTAPSLDASTSSLIPLPHPFVIPGDRFREVYYWDTYWIILGLVASGDRGLALGMVHNLLHLVETHGFVPNGTRTYYLNRSQPPLLSCMVRVCAFDGEGRLDEVGRVLLSRALPCLIQTWTYWNSNNKSICVKRPGKSSVKMTRYFADWDRPRPESYREDFSLAERLFPDGGKGSDHEESRRRLYRDISSAAESGWDFSSRWFREGGGIESIRTTRVVPADLNALLYRTAVDVSEWAGLLGDFEAESTFRQHSLDRLEALHEFMWDSDDGCFHDLLLSEGDPIDGLDAEQIRRTYASNWVPLWCGCCKGQEADVIRGLRSSDLIQEAGVLTSIYRTNEQWDAPNAWAPLQHMVIEGLMTSGLKEGHDLAAEIARRWIKTNLMTFEKTGFMHEKYNSFKPGEGGGGGEYEPQVGFGWSNGVLLHLLELFPDIQPADD